MHVKGILHQALHLENILVSYPNGAVPHLLKLAYFGFLRVSSCLDPLWKRISLRGTNEKWMAPEIYLVEEEEFTKSWFAQSSVTGQSYVLSEINCFFRRSAMSLTAIRGLRCCFGNALVVKARQG